MALSGSPWHSGWARRAGGAQLREAEVQASGGPMSRPWRRTGRGWKDLADRELKPRTQRFMRGSRSQHAEAREGATDRGQTEGRPGTRRASVTQGKEDEARGCHPRRGDRGGWAPAGCSQPWDMREACHTELGGTRPQAHGDSRAQVSAPARWEQVWGRQGRCAAHLGGPRREGPGAPPAGPAPKRPVCLRTAPRSPRRHCRPGEKCPRGRGPGWRPPELP